MRSGGGRRANKTRALDRSDRPTVNAKNKASVSRSSMGGFIGENAIFHLKLNHGHSAYTSDVNGELSVSGYFSPDGLPGWAAFGTLFKFFKPLRSRLVVQNLRGVDENGQISIRVSSDPLDSIESTIAGEVKRGAKLISIATLTNKDLDIDLLSVTAKEDSTVIEWKPWHATTPFGDSKEYGQIFIRGVYLPASTICLSVLTRTEISFRSLLNI